MLAVTILGAILRFVGATANGYNLDEVWSIWIGRQNVPDMVGSFLFDNLDSTPPTYYAMLHPFLMFSQDYLVVRLISIVAGTLVVFFTFRLALMLFDLRIATLSGLLMAIAPFHIEYSQVARSYMLTALFALLSLYFFAKVLFQGGGRWNWIGLVVCSALMLYTHYLSIFVVLYENGFVALLWLRHTFHPRLRRQWIRAQAALVVAALPLAGTSVFMLAHIKPGRGLAWLARPDVQSLIKSAILFTTGDPSYGPTGVTIPRLFSLLLLVAIAALGTWLFVGYVKRRQGKEVEKVLLVACAVIVPIMVAFVVSQAKSVYNEKYLLMVMPPVAILIAWTLLRSSQGLIATGLTVVLIAMTSWSAFVYYTAPSGEQWREAIAYLHTQYKRGDLVVISPAYYARPFAYYFYGDFPADMRTLTFSSVIKVQDGNYTGLDLAAAAQQEAGQLATDSQITNANRVYLVSGYVPADAGIEAWLKDNFALRQQADYLGAHVQTFERVSR
jgi:uncharacterized membrane protein